jgi:monoamine oxidase
VAVFEATDRIGGRLHTVVPEGAPALRGELGGIAIITTQRLVVETVQELGLEREPLVGGDPHDLLFLRGRRFTAADWADPDAVPFELAGTERGRSPEQIFAAAVGALVPDAAELTPREWDERKQALSHDGRPLTEIGLWDLLRSLLSPEAFELISDAGGFRPEFQNWNAAEALVDVTAGWPVEARYERLRDGYEALPRALAERIAAGGGGLAVGNRVVGIREGGGAPLRLEVEGGAPTAAHRVVLALPRHGLAQLAPHTPLGADERFRADLGAVTTVPLFHLLLAYERPWWEQLGIDNGRSATDLPVQSCFYFGTDPDTGRALAMVGYSSEDAIAFWDGYLGERGPDREPRPERPPPEMLVEVTRQLSELHGIEVPAPYWAQLMDWRGGVFGGASHRWAIGARSWEVIPRMRRPLAGLPLHVCGEAWSGLQGWNEGAIRSAERVLRDEIGLPAPDWMSADAYLGP